LHQVSHFPPFILPLPPDRGILDWKNDSSGNEGGTGGTDPDAPNSDPQNAGSPPKEKERGDKENSSRNKLFRTTSGTAAMSSGKKKQSLNLTADPPKSLLDACLSPTNVEPRKTLLEQLSRTFATDEAVLPEVVTMIGPAESFNTTFTARLTAILSSASRPTFLPHNTAEVKAVLQALMVKIQK
jgi:phosphofurin acidic cluster sorting protein 2